GIKKDVVVTPLLADNPGRVAIYGWHQRNGVPVQPLHLGHVDYYVDYSHGIRLVKQQMVVNGAQMSVADALADPDLQVLLSDEGVVANPTLPTRMPISLVGPISHTRSDRRTCRPDFHTERRTSAWGCDRSSRPGPYAESPRRDCRGG
ncbi:MAG: hypothetical protein ACE5I3_09200, partial [Phycisphaerae bacterium]